MYNNSFRKSGLAATLVGVLALGVVSTAATYAQSGHVAENLPTIDISDGFADLVQAVKPAVVNISVTGTVTGSGQSPFRGQNPELEEFFKRFFGDQFESPDGTPQPFQRKTTAVGSGFVVDPSGLVVTNNHVIEDADEIEVVFDDGTRVPAELKGTDSKTDLALLEIKSDDDREYPFVKFGDSDSSRVGDWVFAIGNPFGLGGTTTKGIISARGRDIRSGPLDDFIQIDAPINRGNSGGPLFNTRGEVIGVNSAIFSPNGGSVGIGFAIPSSMAENVISQLRDTGTVQRGYLGVQIQTVSDDIAESLGLDKARGALVSQVIEKSPAEKSGIETGDVILEFDGSEIDRMRELPKVVALTKTDKEVDVVVWRDEEEMTLQVAVGGNADARIAASENTADKTGILGMKLSALNDSTRQQLGLDEETTGVVITAVDPEGPAAERGIANGELIRKVGNDEVESPADVEGLIEQARDDGKSSILLLVEREGRVRYVVIPFDES